jgi:osmotically-inducible protein OsmY
MLVEHLSQQPWAETSRINVIVHDGVVELWGRANSDDEKNAIRVAAETTAGVRAVNDHLAVAPRPARPELIEHDITTR